MTTKSSIRILTTGAAALLATFASTQSAQAQAISITGTGTYLQNFDTLPTAAGNWANDVTLPAWYATSYTTTGDVLGAQVNPLPLGIYNTGAARASGFFSAGTGSERALAWGGTTTNYGISSAAVIFQNNSGSAISIGNISYIGELFAETSAVANLDGLSVDYRISGALNTNVGFTISNLNGSSHATNAARVDTGWTLLPSLIYSRQGDGDATANEIMNPALTNAISATAGITLQPNEFIALRFRSMNDSGTDGIIGLDNLSISYATISASLKYNLAHTVGGAPNGVWSVSADQYWLSSGNPVGFTDNSPVEFIDSPAGTATIDVPSAVAPNSITFTHASGTYAIGGVGAISTGSLTKTGDGNVTLTSPGTYTSVNLAGGTVVIGNATALGTGSITATGAVTLQADVNTTAAGFSGVGPITKTGTANITTSAITTAPITVNVDAGKLNIGNAAGFSSTTSTINVNTGGSLDVTAPTTATVIAGNVNFTDPAGGLLTINSPTEVGLSASGLTITKANGITSAGPITKAGQGTVRITTAQALTNNWTITGGFLEAQNATSFGTGTITANGGWVSITGVTITNPIVLNGGGIGVRSGAPAAPVENYAGAVSVTADSFLTPKRTSTFANYNGYFLTGALTGSNSLTVTGPIVAALLVAPFTPENTPVNPSLGATTTTVGAVTLTNGANGYSGNFIVSSQQILSGLPSGGTGGTVFGTASFTLKGGAVRVLDNGTADNGVISYNHPITVGVPNDAVNPGVATVFVDRQTNAAAPGGANLGTQGTFSGNTVQFSTLSLLGGQTFRTAGANAYGVSFSGAASVTGTGDVTIDTATAPLALAGGLGGGAFNLVKTGASTLTITGPNTYTGNTTVSGGTLDITSGGLTVGVGQNISGVGNVTGVVTASGGGSVHPGNATGVGTLTMTDLTLGTSSVQYTFNAGTVGLVSVGNLLLTGGASSVTLNFLGLNPNLGTQTLIDYTGTALDNTQFAKFTQGALFSRIEASLVNNTVNTSVDLNVTGIKFPIWTGSVSTEWSTAAIAGTKNWVLNGGGAQTDFIASDKVLFDNTPTAAAPIVDISVADVSPADVLVDSTKNYTINGPFAIAGAGPLVKNNTGTLTITNTNSFTGAVSLNGGVTSVATVADSAVNSPLGAGTTVNFNGGTLEFTGVAGSTNRAVTLGAGGGTVTTPTGSALTLAGVVGPVGGGALTKTGNGTLVLTGLTNALSAVNVTQGTLQVGDGVALGSIGATATIANDATLAFNTPTGNLAVPNVISGTGALTKTGAGSVTLSGATANTYSGTTTVSGGTLILSHSDGINSVGGNVVVETGGIVAYGTTAGQRTGQVPDGASVTINGGTFGSGAGNTEIAPTAGIFDAVGSVTLNSGIFLSGRGDATAFSVAGAFTANGGRAYLQRGGSVSADSITLESGVILDMDGGSTGFTSRLVATGPAGVTIKGAAVNMNTGSNVTATSFGSAIVLNGPLTTTGSTTLTRVSTQAAPRAQIELNGASRVIDVTGTLTLGTTAQKVDIVNTGATPGGIIKQGSGNLVLNGANTFNGDTVISDGTLTLTGTLSGSASIDVQTSKTFDVSGVAGGFSLDAAQTLKGTGNVIGSTTIGGTLAPGASIGTLNFANDLIFGAGGNGLFEINKAGVTRTADLANVTGALTLAGTLNVTATGDTLIEGDSFNLFDAASFAGTMAPGALPTLDLGLFWSLDNLGVDGTITVIPEPGSAALLVLGSALLFRRRRQA